MTYTRAGDVASVRDPAGKVTSYTYDPLGRVLTTTETTATFPAGLTTSYTYDGLGRVVMTTGPPVTDRVTGAVHTAVATVVFDADGQTTTQTVADATGGDASRTTTTAYNTYGQVSSTTDPTGAKTSYVYDSNGRLIKETHPDGQVVRSTYNTEGALIKTSVDNYTGDPNNPGTATQLRVVSYYHDAAGRLASTVDAMGWKTSYTFTDNNLPVKTTRVDPATGAEFVTEKLLYDAAGQVRWRAVNNYQTVTTYDLDAAGRTTASTLNPAGLNRKTTSTFSPDDHVLATTLTDRAGAVVAKSQATYDPLGRVTSRSIVAENNRLITSRWVLDEAGRALSATDPLGNTTTYAYDEASRLVMTVDPTVTTETAGGTPVATHPVTTVGVQHVRRAGGDLRRPGQHHHHHPRRRRPAHGDQVAVLHPTGLVDADHPDHQHRLRQPRAGHVHHGCAGADHPVRL